MKKTGSLLLFAAMVLALTACGQAAASDKQKEIQPSVQKTEEQSETSRDGAETVKQEMEEQQTEERQDAEETLPESVSAEEQEADVRTKTLVVYFSCTGTTEAIAAYITEIAGADIYEIIPEKPYTEADLAYYTDGRADQEQNDPAARPAISGGVENMEEYDIIILGYPIWHGQAPRIISTFLESYDFAGKTIIPFCTSHSSGIGSSADNLHALCSELTTWSEGKRFDRGTSKEDIAEWMEEAGLNETK